MSPLAPPPCVKCSAPMRRIACLAPLRLGDKAKVAFLCVPCDHVKFIEDRDAIRA